MNLVNLVCSLLLERPTKVMYLLNLTSIHVGSAYSSLCFFIFFSCEKCSFCKNLSFLLCFAVCFHILSNTSSVVFFLFLFSSRLHLECLLSSAPNHFLLPPHVLQCVTAGLCKETDVSHCGWVDLITTLGSTGVEQMTPGLIAESGLVHKLPSVRPSTRYNLSPDLQHDIFCNYMTVQSLMMWVPAYAYNIFIFRTWLNFTFLSRCVSKSTWFLD